PPKLAGIMAQGIEARIACPEPPGEEVEREREAVHLGKERDDERRECAERPPVAPGARMGEAEGEDDEDRRVGEGEGPEVIRGHLVIHRSSSRAVPWRWPSCPRCMKRCISGHARSRR